MWGVREEGKKFLADWRSICPVFTRLDQPGAKFQMIKADLGV